MCKGFMQRINSSKDGIQMAKKQMKKKCSTLVTWEMQIKTIMRYHFTPTRIVDILYSPSKR